MNRSLRRGFFKILFQNDLIVGTKNCFLTIPNPKFELQDLALLNNQTIIINNRDAQTIEFAKIE